MKDFNATQIFCDFAIFLDDLHVFSGTQISSVVDSMYLGHAKLLNKFWVNSIKTTYSICDGIMYICSV